MTEDWKEEASKVVNPYKKMMDIIRKLDIMIEKNRLYEAKRYFFIELENAKGITEQKCKKKKLRKDICEHCKNLNCNLNRNVSKNN